MVLPSSMEAFLSIPENKTRLERELGEDTLANTPPDKVITVFGDLKIPLKSDAPKTLTQKT